MSFKKLTACQKRIILRKYHENRYQDLIGHQFDKLSEARKNGKTVSKEQAKAKIKLLSRERNIRLAELDQASDEKVEQLYKKAFGLKGKLFGRRRR